MISFRELQEDKGGKNLHLEHLEDEIINFVFDGGRALVMVVAMVVVVVVVVVFWC
jgi:hypothetical protein